MNSCKAHFNQDGKAQTENVMKGNEINQKTGTSVRLGTEIPCLGNSKQLKILKENTLRNLSRTVTCVLPLWGRG